MDTGPNKDDEDQTEKPHPGEQFEESSESSDKDSKSTTTSLKYSFKQKLKNPGIFLSNTLQRSAESSTRNEPTIIPSSLASAFSSMSSFTSNFSLNSQSNNNSSTLSSSNSGTSLTIETASTITRLSHVSETKEEIFNRKATLERKNLINLTKLIVKDLISSSLAVNRTIDDGCQAVHLTNYFTLVERVLKHGLRENVFSGRASSLWSALESLPKYLKESTLIAESVRSLPNTKSSDGKIRAWMRLAMMQKKLPEYFSELIANKNILLKNVYYDYAFMLSDEAHVFAGLIIGVNVIDCNFFVKDANFDLMDEVIELSPYLKIANSYDSEGSENEVELLDVDNSNIKSVLDQKNYLEEWNKRLEGSISDLQTKIRSLEEQNSKLEMEAKLSEAKIKKLQGYSETAQTSETTVASSITGAIKSLIGSSSNNSQRSQNIPDVGVEVVSSPTEDRLDVIKEMSETVQGSIGPGIDPQEPSEESRSLVSQVSMSSRQQIRENGRSESTDLAKLDESYREQIKELENELKCLRERVAILEASYRTSLDKIKVLERDLDIQTTMNADKETTIKIYEKDIREKQAQVESIRGSLIDAKKLNTDLSERLNDTNNKSKERLKMVTSLQANLDKWKLENKNIATRLQEKSSALKSLTIEMETTQKVIQDLKKYNEKLNDELRKERESGQSSSVTVETQNIQILELVAKVENLEKDSKDIESLRKQRDELEKRCKEYELSLEEIGYQLRESRLEVENLKENSAVFLDSQWKDDKQVKACTLCQQPFSVTRRKHHCRLCGNVFCQTCSDNKMELASSSKPARVCDTCHGFLLAKFVKTSTS